MDSPETTTDYHFDARQFTLWLPVYLAIAMALYILSAGPMYWTIYEAFFVGHNPLIQTLYLPLVWLASNSDLFGQWMEWYVGLWVY